MDGDNTAHGCWIFAQTIGRSTLLHCAQTQRTSALGHGQGNIKIKMDWRRARNSSIFDAGILPDWRDYEAAPGSLFFEQIGTVKQEPVSADFIAKLKQVQLYSKRDELLMHVDCTHCHAQSIGSGQFNVKQSGQSWYYSQALLHYYEHHNAHPTELFYDFVMEFKIPTAQDFLAEMLNLGSIYPLAVLRNIQAYPRDVQELWNQYDWKEYYERLVNSNVQKVMSGCAIIEYSN